jgi:hypothetical protein
MMRILFVSLFAFIVQLFLAALSESTVLLAPAALVLVTMQFSLVESLATMLLLGFLLDCWVGATIGVMMGVLALMWALSVAANMWLGKPNFLIRTAFIFAFALAFRALVALALGIQGGSQGNWEWIQILIMPFFDVGVGLLFYRATMRILTLFGLCELRENTSQRLSRRSPRISLE